MTTTITRQQDIVLKVIQDYLDNNRILDLDKVIPYIKSYFSKSGININDNGLKLIIRTLIENRYIINGSKLSRNNILQNINRKRVYTIIKQKSGLNFNQILTILDLSYHVVAWHVNVLVKFECIKKVKIEKHNIYFHNNVPSSNYIILHLLNKKKVKKIISYLRENEDDGITKSSASNNLKMNYQVISKYIDQLENSGILKKETFSNKNLYYLSQKYYKSFSIQQ